MSNFFRNLWKEHRIWLYAFGYFAAYVPFTFLLKSLSKGLLPNQAKAISGFSMLPLSVGASIVSMLLVITYLGWWKHASRIKLGEISLPAPTRWTFVSGLCTALIVITTTLAYTFEGVSIVLVMLLMRGGLLVLAPLVDLLSGRRSRWFSWVGLLLSLAALFVAFWEKRGFDITILCTIDIIVYLTSYFVRLRFMSKLAKSEDDNIAKKYFVEEQIVATPAVFIFLFSLYCMSSLSTSNPILDAVSFGFSDIFSTNVWPYVIFIGFCSQLTGVFGGLVLLDKSENTYSIPVNRCSSILAGVLASFLLAALMGQKLPSNYQLIGAALILCAILALTIPVMMPQSKTTKD